MADTNAQKMKFSINDFFKKCDQIRHWCRSGVFIVKFEHISQLDLLFVLLTLNK